MIDEKCPNCSSEDYDIDNYWDNFDAEGAVCVWKCICPQCHTKFDITYAYQCTGITVEISES